MLRSPRLEVLEISIENKNVVYNEGKGGKMISNKKKYEVSFLNIGSKTTSAYPFFTIS